MGNKKKGKILAVLLGGVLLGTQIPGMVWAEEAAGYSGGICEHHPVHTAECGYQEAVPEQPCRHEHTKECYEYVTNCVHEHTEECYPLIAVDVSAEEPDTEETSENAEEAAEPQTELVRGPKPTACTHVCSEESGCVTKTLNCIHEDKVNADGSKTPAVHDASCGYAPAVEGKECTFVCGICSVPEETDSETETSTEKTSDSDAETEPEEAEPDEAVTEVQAMIDALPTVEKVKQMTKDAQKEVYEKAEAAADAYFDGLTAEQQEQVDLKKLMDLMNFFNGQVSTMAEGYTLTDGVLTITSSAGLGNFRANTSIKSVIIEKGVEGSIGDHAFYWCTNLTSVTIEEGANITSIGDYAFRECSSLTSITIPEGVTSIGTWAFYKCTSLMSITIEEGTNITSIGGNAFRGCTSLMSITIEEGATIGIIGNYAFYECGLTSVTIEKGATIGSIGMGAFLICSSLTSITIPEGVTSIGEWAFNGCQQLTEVTLPATAPTTVDTNSFYGLWNQINFIIPETSIGTEKGQYNLNASPWKSIVMLNGSRLIRSVDVTLTEPVGGSVLSTEASCTTAGVEKNISVSWTLNGAPVTDGAKAGYGESYTAKITLTAVTSTDTSDTAQSYRFVDGISATLNNTTGVTATVSDSGKTLKISKTYILKQSQNSPDISINYQDETLNTTADMEYSTDEGGSWSDCNAAMDVAALGWNGTAKTVQIRMKETADAYASDPASVTIPARPAITVSQVTDSTTASIINVQAAGVPQGAAVQYQLVAAGGNLEENNWKKSGEFMNLKAGTAYTAYAKCGATSGSFASNISSGQQVSTSAASYTVSIPSETLKAGNSTSKAEISVDTSKSFDLGYNGQVQVKVQSGGAVSSDGVLTLTRQGASDTLTSAMYVDGSTFTDIDNPVATFTMNNHRTEKAAVSFAEPQLTGTQTVIPAGIYSGTVTFEVSYSD